MTQLKQGVSDDVDLPPLLPLARRAFKHPALMHFNRLAAGVIAVNLAVLIAAMPDISAEFASRAALCNFALAVLIRRQRLINLLFKLATAAPVTWPLRVRWTLAKVYHFGGLHVGGALAGSLWFGAFVVLATVELAPADVLAVAYALVALFAAMLVTTVPKLRAKHHDRFELVHRFGGWLSLVLLWWMTMLQIGHGGEPVFAVLEFRVLVVVTIAIVAPWTRLRRVPVDVKRPSSHVAIARFTHGRKPFAGSSTAISRSPLLEWHSFANIPSPDEHGFRLTISRAGDWTGRFIDEQPSHVWVKGITVAGVANIEVLFRKVVYVATGSGIGPCLPHLLAQEVPALLVWSTRAPRDTFGDELVDEILAVQPDARIWDTAQHGKPDMVRLAVAAYRDFGAEAVICISNKKLTWQVVHGLERRGIPAYGAIWDS
ncbi:hypothetical protein [Glycomyces algeriensis]|uniref:Uncharacterized protein n=1 Tax=Glycomyces algeriensis TaxID=256037 RepID=A0A9W6G4G8_9ACTN|nr:hypothetical protein [Glycomyces algeriensis]MDA1368032.1 hypothetical protein [Glycomyces algeriensis]MDR7352541.1 hypothetical protein [Glycomyces algeriensis]GLI40222.1 hypothetical protein GALLR39Z86_00720 [Glycomyces algeriensis]